MFIKKITVLRNMVNASEAASAVVETAQSYVQTVAISVVILLGGFALGILVKKVVQKVLQEIGLNRMMTKVSILSNVESGISSLAAGVIYVATLFLFLDYLNITPFVLYIVLGAVIMLLLLTFLVGLKDIIPNFIAGVIIQRRGRIKVGKHLEVREIAGVVERVGLLETEIRTDRQDILYVPNSLFLKSKFRMKK